MLHHGGDEVIWGNNDIVTASSPTLHFGEHAFGVFVEVDDQFAVEAFLEFLRDFRRKIFAPDEQIEALFGGARGT